MTRTGWICSRCGASNSPDKMTCNCSNQLPIAPWQPSTPIWPGVPSRTLEIRCPKCGLDCSGSMGYVCNDPMCPMGLGPVTCKTE